MGDAISTRVSCFLFSPSNGLSDRRRQAIAQRVKMQPAIRNKTERIFVTRVEASGSVTLDRNAVKESAARNHGPAFWGRRQM